MAGTVQLTVCTAFSALLVHTETETYRKTLHGTMTAGSSSQIARNKTNYRGQSVKRSTCSGSRLKVGHSSEVMWAAVPIGWLPAKKKLVGAGVPTAGDSMTMFPHSGT